MTTASPPMTTVKPLRPQLNSDELHQVRWFLGGLLTLLALSTVWYMDVGGRAVMAVAAAGTLVALLQPAWPARIPGFVHTLAFPVVAGFFAIDLWRQGEILPAMVRLDMLLLFYRGVMYRQRRDDLQVIVLGLFLVVVAGVLTVSLLFAVHLLVYTACALGLLSLITMTDGRGRAPGVTLPEPGTVPSWAQGVRWRALAGRLWQATDWRLAVFGALLFAGVVAVSALLFLAIPRFQLESTLFLDRLITKKSRTGFSDTIRFGDVTEIQQDNRLAMSVDVADPSQVPASPYWRMLVLDDYTNGTFKMSNALRMQEFGPERTRSFVPGDTRLRTGPEAYWTFYLEAGTSRYLPLLGPFGELRFREQQHARLALNMGVVALRNEPATMLAYRVEGFRFAPLLPDPAFARRWAERTSPVPPGIALQSRLLLPEPDLRAVMAAVASITGGRRLEAAEFAQTASQWLRQQHGYSLSPVIPPGSGDPLVRWMLSRNAGHCELFAGSLVVLARAAGFPARVVTGFRGGTWNAYSNNFTIRNADAHAWTEIFDAEAGGWLRADALEPPRAEGATGPTVGQEVLAGRVDRSWKARLESLRVFWYRRIVSFDQASQLETLKAVKEVTQESGQRLQAWFTGRREALRAWWEEPWDVARVLRWSGGLAGVLALGLLLRRYGRRLWRWLTRRQGAGREDPIRREAGRWLARLRAQADAEPTAERAATIAALQRLRYGARGTWDDPERIFRGARQAGRRTRRRVSSR